MILQSRNLIPKPYTISRDYQVLLKLFDIISTVEKSDIDNFVGLLNPDKCPSKYLPLLAAVVGYDYDYNLSYEANRIIIKYFPDLLRLRGSENGIKMAVAIAIGAQQEYREITNVQNLVNINYIYDSEQTIDRLDVYIYYPHYLNKIYDLIELVRPVGVGFKLIPAKSLRNKKDDTVDIYVNVSHTHGDLDKSERYKVSESNQAGFGEVAKIIEEENNL